MDQKLAAVMAVLLGLLGGCGPPRELSREAAAKLIDGSLATLRAIQIDPGSIRCPVNSGLVDVNTAFFRCSSQIGPRGSGVVKATSFRCGTGGAELDIEFTQQPRFRVSEVTGISDMPNMDGYKEVQYIGRFDFAPLTSLPAEAACIKNDVKYQMRAVLRRYDDGWRVEQSPYPRLVTGAAPLSQAEIAQQQAQARQAALNDRYSEALSRVMSLAGGGRISPDNEYKCELNARVDPSAQRTPPNAGRFYRPPDRYNFNVRHINVQSPVFESEHQIEFTCSDPSKYCAVGFSGASGRNGNLAVVPYAEGKKVEMFQALKDLQSVCFEIQTW